MKKLAENSSAVEEAHRISAEGLAAVGQAVGGEANAPASVLATAYAALAPTIQHWPDDKLLPGALEAVEM